MKKLFSTTIYFLLAASAGSAQDAFIRDHLKAAELTWQGDLSERMVAQVDSFLTRKALKTKELREQEWTARSRAGDAAWNGYLEEKKLLLQKTWGMTGARKKPAIEIETNPLTLEQAIIQAGNVRIFPVKWSVADGLDMAGLLLQPQKAVRGRLVMIPDADQTPEELAGIKSPRNGKEVFPALRLAEQGIQVLIPALISRSQEFSGSSPLNIYTNQPHREWIYRQGFNLGRHIIGYELQKIASCIDWLEMQNAGGNARVLPIGIAGYGEGGMLALFAASVERRLSAVLISGYLGNSDGIWREPIYRNLHNPLTLAGNAELLAMSSHAGIVVEYAKSPEVGDPAPVEGRRNVAAPGKLVTPSPAALQREIDQALGYRKGGKITLVSDKGSPFAQPFSAAALEALAGAMKVPVALSPAPATTVPAYWPDPRLREKHLFEQMENLIQQELDTCEKNRNRAFWSRIQHNPEKDAPFKTQERERFHQVIGKIQDPLLPPSPKARLLESTPGWRKYEVVLDVWDGVFTWGILVVPTSADLKRPHPVVVCQHGLEGLPDGLVSRDTSDRKFKIYKSMGLALAERGYIVFLPHNPYRGEHLFRVLQRKANPIGLSLFSVIAGQHQQIVKWLGSLPFADKEKIGFYGLSYGGKTAMRIPALVEGYALSVCSGDFNEWIRKVATTRASFSYQFTKEYEIYEWDLGHHFNYAEMAALIAPRPFMVEYGYKDGIGTAEWIGYEFGKVRKHYDLSGLSDRLDIDLFDGVHEIHAVRTYPFLDKHLKAP